MRFQIIVFDGFDELDVVGPFEVLQSAKGAGATTELVTVDPPREIVASHGLTILPAVQLNVKNPPDVVIVPGGGWLARAPRGARAEVERGVVPAAVKSLHEAGTIVASVCTGAMLLAAAGLLQGRWATTNRGAIADLQAAGVNVVPARVVDDGDIVTAAGVTSGLDLALWLVERFFGAKAAQQIETTLEHERRGTVWRQIS
jgi:transcriptional regulator GlxA family with amidase domain